MSNLYGLIHLALTLMQVLLGTASIYSLINQAVMFAMVTMFVLFIISFIKLTLESHNDTPSAC